MKGQPILKAVRVLVGDSVYEDAQVSVREGMIHVEFDAEDLESIALPVQALEP